MPIEQAGSRSFCALREVDGASASIDRTAITSETIPPPPGERTDRTDPIQTSTIANRGWRHRFRQKQPADPELDHRSQLRPRRHCCQLYYQLIDVRADTAGQEKLQAVGKAVQF